MNLIEKLVKENWARKRLYAAQCARKALWKTIGRKARPIGGFHAIWKVTKFLVSRGTVRTEIGKISQHIKVIRWDKV